MYNIFLLFKCVRFSALEMKTKRKNSINHFNPFIDIVAGEHKSKRINVVINMQLLSFINIIFIIIQTVERVVYNNKI